MNNLLLKQSQTAYPLIFQIVQSSDHVTGLAGATPTVTLSKNGGSFASPAGTVSEIANGYYQVAANATDTNTLGPLILHATATNGDPVDVVYQVVGFDPGSALISAGTGANQLHVVGGVADGNVVQVNGTSATTTALPGVDGNGRVAIQVGTGAGQINGANGKVPATLDPADVAGTPTGTVSGTPSPTSFAATGTLSSASGAYANSYLRFEAGSANAGLALPITSYNGSTNTFGFSVAWPATPAAGDTFVILGSHVP